ncbi:hypothetical protein [Streptomyces sp. EN16]|uniref:hypothetical protein n=1 Tax=Streptomyces sp. EN16 TaxID=212773 RepID=UPI000851A48D|nr:hypothetical protein [Streptomyces sp. EN16]
MTTSPQTGTFDVYIAGEQIPGTEIGMTFIYVTTPLGRVRMTADEAEALGQKLIAAAEYDQQSEVDDDRLDEEYPS